MVTTLVSALVDRLLEEFPPSRSYVASDVVGDPIPGPVADYLKQDLRTRLAAAVPHPPAESWIDAKDRGVQRARSNYLEALAAHQAIPADQWADVVRRACDETVRVLVRPSSGLTEAVFGRSGGSVEPRVLFSKLDYFPSYPYFREVVEAYLEQKSIAQIDRSRFEGLINRIDRQMTSDYEPAEWLRLLRPLLSVLRGAGYQNELPVDILAAFLEEKGADEPLSRLRQRVGSGRNIGKDILAELFREAAGDGAAASETHTERVPSGATSDDQERSPVPLWKQFEQGAPVEARAASSESKSSSGSLGRQPLWKQFRSTPERPSQATSPSTPSDLPLEELEQTVLGSRGARNRDMFVRHLFSGDRDDYEATLRKLQQVGSWSEASKVIAQDVFLRNQVNIYSDPAVAFTDAAEARYRS